MSLGCSGTNLSVVLIVLCCLSCSAYTEPPVGNVGCLFSGLVCGEYEVCFNDLVIGRCVSASSNNQHLTRLGPLSGPPLGLLEAELSRVFGLGFSWPDLYTQCVFQSLIHSIENRLPYYKQQCSHLLGAQRYLSLKEEDDLDDDGKEEEFQPHFDTEDVLEDNDEEDDDQQLFVPQVNLRYGDEYPAEEDNEAINEDDLRDMINNHDYVPYGVDLTPDDETNAFTQLQQVLHGLPTSQELEESRQVLIPMEIDPQDPEGNFYVLSPREIQYLPEVLQQPEDDYSKSPLVYSPYSYNQDISPNNFQQNLPDERLDRLPIELIQPSTYYIPQQQPYIHLRNDDEPSDDYIENEDNLQPNHPLEKREAPTDDNNDSSSLASSYNIPVSPNLDIDPKDADYDVPDIYQTKPFLPVDNREILENDYSDEDTFVADSDKSYWKPNEEDSPLLLPRTNKEDDDEQSDNDSYEEDSNTDENVSNYDFDYADSSADPEEEDIIYYNPDSDQLPMESVFDRHGRLDVKKPGPFFTNSPNNFYLDKLLPDDKLDDDTDDDAGQTEYEDPLPAKPTGQKRDLPESVASFTDPDIHHDNYLHVNIKDRFTSLGQANKLADFIADHLQVKRKVFTEFRPEQSRLLLKVNSNPQGLNATGMANKLASDPNIRSHAKEDLGVDIDNFAAGGKDSVISIYSGPPSRLFLLLFILTAGLASLLIVAAVLLLLRRRARLKTKVVENTKEEKEEPVKEYKQLVRDWSRSSRASGSNSSQGGVGAKGGEEPGAAQSPVKVALKRSSQNSDGSRTSSTSSWQEEPGVTTMDISTGHMVLSYMEDHLKNKQRLEQEWVGLCAYEAEPNSTAIAFKVENKKKNRYPDKLPYDHNRVLLNALVNGSNSDYINASTVMDHDPRNPAYIITQGPLAHTVADFWQMVWEQGSVVIVMLSRLQENGYHLAHRYWPEEGSEQYHIFEVHLVSEHVWCDDYLVRSLYLKNTQTGETRTVTQFHFLSWPDSNIPTSTRAILEFRRKVNKSYRGRSCPMIIHCSDGVGRSGTYVLIDMVLNRMTKGSKEIDIAATLEHIRDQRSGMVQTRSQFEFCLMAVAEETHAILKALPQ